MKERARYFKSITSSEAFSGVLTILLVVLSSAFVFSAYRLSSAVGRVNDKVDTLSDRIYEFKSINRNERREKYKGDDPTSFKTVVENAIKVELKHIRGGTAFQTPPDGDPLLGLGPQPVNKLIIDILERSPFNVYMGLPLTVGDIFTLNTSNAIGIKVFNGKIYLDRIIRDHKGDTMIFCGKEGMVARGKFINPDKTFSFGMAIDKSTFEVVDPYGVLVFSLRVLGPNTVSISGCELDPSYKDLLTLIGNGVFQTIPSNLPPVKIIDTMSKLGVRPYFVWKQRDFKPV